MVLGGKAVRNAGKDRKDVARWLIDQIDPD
jgi:hypothetical protein